MIKEDNNWDEAHLELNKETPGDTCPNCVKVTPL